MLSRAQSLAQIIAVGDADVSAANAAEVPVSGRMSRFALMMSFWAISSAMFWMVVAATLASTYGAINAIIALAMAVTTFSVINGGIARFGIESGLSVALFSKVLFGSIGADLAAVLLFATATWYAVFEGSVIAQAFHLFLNLPINVAYLLVVIYSVALMFGSIQNWLDKFNGALLPVYLAGLAGAITLAGVRYGFGTAWLSFIPAGGAPAHGWFNCYVVYLGVWSMMMFTLDYARFGRQQDLAYHTKITFGWGFYTFSLLGNGLVGIFLIGTVPLSGSISEIAVVTILLKLMGWAGLLFVWVSQTRINTANFYVAALNLTPILNRLGWHRVSRPVCAIIVGCLVFIIMRLDVFSILLRALAYQGVLIEAWVAIALTYILLARHRRSAAIAPGSDLPASALKNLGIFAWFSATIVGVAMLNMGQSLSLFSAPMTAVCAASIYYLGLHPRFAYLYRLRN